MRSDLVSEKDAAKYIGLSYATLGEHRRLGQPLVKYIQHKRNSPVFYRVSDLDEYLDEKAERSVA